MVSTFLFKFQKEDSNIVWDVCTSAQFSQKLSFVCLVEFKQFFVVGLTFEGHAMLYSGFLSWGTKPFIFYNEM